MTVNYHYRIILAVIPWTTCCYWYYRFFIHHNRLHCLSTVHTRPICYTYSSVSVCF